jgi:hypothetical protein
MKTSKIIRPLYDPVEHEWFYGSAHAPTIRELREKLPKGTLVADYYPIGTETPRTIWPKGNGELRPHLPGSFHTTNRQSQAGMERALQKAAELRAERALIPVLPAHEKPRTLHTPENIEQVREMRVNGQSYGHIASVLGQTRGVVAGIWHRLRHRYVE